jgi:phosphatidylinositol alpha 1,6-mannosyltransferase
MRIVIGCDTFTPEVNGAARFAQRLACGLVKRGHEVYVLAPSTEGPPSVRRENGVTVHRLVSYRTPFHPTFRVVMPWSARRGAAELLDAVQPDVVHVQAHFLIGRMLCAQSVRRGIPIVATNHFMPENLFGHARVPRLLQRPVARRAWADVARVLGRAAVVTAPTPRAVQLLVSSAGLTAAVPVSCGIDVARYRRVAPERTGPPTVLFVGRLDEEKRVDELLRGFAALPAAAPSQPAARLEIVGDGSCRAEWVSLAERLGITERVRFAGFIGEEALLDSYARAAVFCMPGVAELQSLATMEAMAAGLPVVAADAMALPHLVRPGQNGWLYPPGDVASLTDRLAHLLTDPNARTAMGAVSLEIASGHELGATLARFETIYASVLDRPAMPNRSAA